MQRVDRDQAIEWLPEAYALALRLRDAGASSEAIAAGLQIDVVAVEPLLSIAQTKLSELLGSVDVNAPDGRRIG